MSDRLEATSLTSLLPGFDWQSPAGSEPPGRWQGEGVQLASAAPSLLARARKHLASLTAHEANIESRQLHHRHFSSHQVSDHHVHSGARARALLGRMPDFDPSRIIPLIEDLDDVEDPRTILKKGRKHFPDPSHAYLALELVQQRLRDSGRHELADQTAEARDQLEDEEGPETRAGINVSLAAYETSNGDRMAAAALRVLYRQVVFAQPGPLGLYLGIMAKGVEKFADQLRFLTRAVGDDLAAAGPSVDPARLYELLRDLSSLRVLDTVHERCNLLVTRLQRGIGHQLSVTDVMGHLLPLVETATADANRFIALPGKLSVPDRPLSSQILFLNEAGAVLAMLPTRLFRSFGDRLLVLEGLRRALDLLIGQEESE